MSSLLRVATRTALQSSSRAEWRSSKSAIPMSLFLQASTNAVETADNPGSSEPATTYRNEQYLFSLLMILSSPMLC